jgi:ribosomal protein S18 acetylase RimI-like enzyme
MNIQYIPYREEHRNELLDMVHGLYTDDSEGEKMTDEKVLATIAFLSNNPDSGDLLIFTEDNAVIGYSILVYYWSNEFGGRIILVDELYLKDSHRSKSIGSNYLGYLFAKKDEDFKAVYLEVFPSNQRAFDFYIRNGFVKIKGNYLKHTL